MKHMNYIRAIREDRGLSQEKLAALTNTTNPQISNLELGKRRLTWEWMLRLAAALECHPSDLIYGLNGNTTQTDELKLLDAYRALPDDKKNIYLEMMEAVANKWKPQ